MNLKELQKEIDALKKTITETIREEIREDRIKTALDERKGAREELNDGLSDLEGIELCPENAQHIGWLITTIEQMKAENDRHTNRIKPISLSEITRIAETRKISNIEVETLFYGVRASEMLKRIEAMKPGILSALMGTFEEPQPSKSPLVEEEMISIESGGVTEMTEDLTDTKTPGRKLKKRSFGMPVGDES